MPQKIARAWRVLLHNCYTAWPRGTRSIFRQPPTLPRRGRCPHRPASSRVQRISMAAFAVGAACMAARAAPPRRMHHRRPHPGRRGALIGSPVGSTTRFRAAIQAAPTRCRASSVGADAHIGPPGSVCKAVRRSKASPLATKGPARERCQWQIQRPQRSGRRPDGGDQSWQGPGAYNPSVSLREPAPFTQGSLPSQALGLAAFGGVRRESKACSGGYIIRPYRRIFCRFPL